MHLHLFLPSAELIERNSALCQRSRQYLRNPLGEYRLPLFAKAVALQLFPHPRRVNRLGKVEVFKQTMQESPRRRPAREVVRRHRRLRLHFSGAGSVEYLGDPEGKKRVSGIGSIKRRGKSAAAARARFRPAAPA